MTVLSDQPVEASPHESSRRSRFLTFTVILLALALAGLGACVLFDPMTTSETEVTAEIDQLLDDYITASNNYDAEAFRAVITDGYKIYEPEFDPRFNVSTRIAFEYDVGWVMNAFERVYEPHGFHWERLGEPIMSGDGPWFVSQAIGVTADWGDRFDDVEGISTLSVVDEGGTLKIARDVFVAFEK